MKILVLDLPALHLGYLGCYGNDWVGTPNLDRLAAEGVVFDRHYFDVAQPKPLEQTGHHPLPWSEERPSFSAPTLGSLLHGHTFLAGTGPCSPESLDTIVEQALDALANPMPLTWVRFPALLPPWNLPADLLNSYCEEDEQPRPDPPHGILETTEDLIPIQNTYAAVVTYVDAQLGVLLEALKDGGKLDSLLVCVTSSFGLPLGEHGYLGPALPWPHEEAVHLPLIMRLPNSASAGLRLPALTQPVDLFPTLLDFLGIAPPPCHGLSLWPLLRDEATAIRPYACSAIKNAAGAGWALRTHDWTLLLPVAESVDLARPPQLFVKPDDRWEVNDVKQHHLEKVEAMEKTLRQFALATQHPGALVYPDL